MIVLVLAAVTLASRCIAGDVLRDVPGLTPTHWYRFDDPSDLGRDSIGNYTLSFAPTATSGTSDPVVGGYVFSGQLGGTIGTSTPTAVSVEFLFRTKDSGFLAGPGGMFDLAVGLQWSLNFPSGHRALSVELDGTGAHSINYASSGWHHVAIVAHPNTSNVTFCLDGNVCQTAPGMPPTYAQLHLGLGPYHNGLALDEIALYEEVLTPQAIWSHYQSTVLKHEPYTFGPLPNVPVPPPVFPNKTYDPTSFTPGSQIPSAPSGTIGANVTALEQLESFPDPRFPTSAAVLSKFERNFNWMAPSFMSKNDLEVSYAQQRLLYTKYHYAVLADENAIGPNQADVAALAKNATAWYGAKHFDTIIMRLETDGGTQLWNKTLPDGCYLQDTNQSTPSKPVFINSNGQVVPKRQAWLRPMTKEIAAQQGCPDQLFNRDGEMFVKSLTAVQAGLQEAGASLSRVNNDGEAFVIIMGNVLEKDAVCRASLKASGAPDWLSFWSEWRRRLSNPGFRDIFMSHLPKTTRFTQYQIQGTNPWFGNWSITREIQSMLKKNQYYSCADFYPFSQYDQTSTPKVVFKSSGPWHGIDWMQMVRQSEIASGNPYFSPFIAAGWSKQSEYNILPGQWLGLMKLFGVWGAEFYYTGFFSLSSPFPDPANWVWQAVVPAYAQAITMQYHDVFFGGSFFGFLETGMANVWCNARKGNTTTKHKYVIACAVEPYSNWEGATPTTIDDVLLQIDGHVITVTARVQGSVYVYEPHQPHGSRLQQLDVWHEATHPYYWGESQ